MMNEQQVITLDVVKIASHAGIALAEPEVVSGVALGGLALRPIPVAAVLEVDDVEAMITDHALSSLKPEVVDAAQGFLEYLRAHDGRPDREDHAPFKVFERAREQLEIE